MSGESNRYENYIGAVVRLKELQDAMRRGWLIPLEQHLGQVVRTRLEGEDQPQR